MRLFLLIPISCFFFSCLTTPKIDLKNNDSKIWTENIKNKTVADDYENIYRFNDKADMNIFIYGYYSTAIKYKLFEVENERAFYYNKTTLKSYIIKTLPNLNFYEFDLSKKLYNPTKQVAYFENNFKNKNIYIVIGLILKDNILYIAKDYSEDYKNKLNSWIENNGNFDGSEWNPILSADWNSYPVPTKEDLDWNNIYEIGEIF